MKTKDDTCPWCTKLLIALLMASAVVYAVKTINPGRNTTPYTNSQDYGNE